MGKVKEESWALTSADTAAIPAANRADGTANQWTDIWKYQVPSGQAHILKPGHFFAAYLEDVGAEVGGGTCQIKIVKRDPSQSEEKALYGPALYVSSKEMQDKDKMARLALQKEELVEEQFFIVVMVKDDGAIDESDSYFKMDTARIRSTI
jgi:hypothetical protein